MTDRIDQGGIPEIPSRENFILGSFLRGPEPTKIKLRENFRKESNFFTEIEKIGPKFLKEEKIPLYKINPSRLEEGNVDRRVDRFIREEMNRRVPQGVSPLPLDNLPVPYLRRKRQFRSSTGFGAAVFDGLQIQLAVKGEKVVLNDYTRINFTPGGRARFDFSRITDSLANGIQGIVALLDAIDQGRFDAAPIFVGTTNINMALIAQRLGFVIVDECRNQDGSINKNLKSFTVVGKLEDIRARVNEFKRAGIDRKLAQRNQRLQTKPKLVPIGT